MGKYIIIAVIVVVVILAIVAYQGRQYSEFVTNAGQVTGVLTAKEERNFRPNQQTGKENWIKYSYQLEGKSYSGEEKIEYADLWHDLKEGQPLEIYYSKTNPSESHPVLVLDKRLSVADAIFTKAKH